MADYVQLYARMVDASEWAIEEMEKQNYGAARDILIAAERQCEELYVSEAEETKR